MPLSCSNTGSTDLRDTEVQQPNTAATLSTDKSCFAFSANSGQLEAGSTTTASSLRPITPPFLFCSSISISMTSFNGDSLIAIVPESECRMPTLIGPVSGAVAALARDTISGRTPEAPPTPVAAAASPSPRRPSRRRSMVKPSDDIGKSPFKFCGGQAPRQIQQDRGQAPRQGLQSAAAPPPAARVARF